jgi:flagellar secretion chaperone FliS
MSYSHAAVAYREREVLTASPSRLVVIVYDHLLANLRRARMAVEVGNIEQRAEAFNRARDAVMELLVSTDADRGGAVGAQLRSLYAWWFNELLTLGLRPDLSQLDRITRMAVELRDTFSKVAVEPAARTPAA